MKPPPDRTTLYLLAWGAVLQATACGGDIETTTGNQDPLDPPVEPYRSDAGPGSPAPDTSITPSAAPGCDHGEQFFDGACYSAPGIKWMTFEAATRVCASRGAQVARIASPAVNDFVFGLLAPLNQQAWIGLRRDFLIFFRWVDGQPLSYHNWAPGEPNNETGTEDCVVMWGPHLTSHPRWQGRWNDTACDAKVDTVICRRVP